MKSYNKFWWRVIAPIQIGAITYYGAIVLAIVVFIYVVWSMS